MRQNIKEKINHHVLYLGGCCESRLSMFIYVKQYDCFTFELNTKHKVLRNPATHFFPASQIMCDKQTSHP